ncbi:MAG: immunoglobulin domain-containing protein [Planctomycetota bacterium]|nr:immunoglobulin domain-containing protein [Planctomycetota bacterium]
MHSRFVAIAAAAVATFSPSVSLGQAYPPGFVWNQNADWVPGVTAGATTGNPSADALGNPVWEAVWVTGDPLGGPNPWYLGAGTRLVWDPSWFGQATNSNWVLSNDTAPSVGRGSFLTPGAPSSPRVAALRWIAPASLPGGLLIDGYYLGAWTNNTATYQVGIARMPGGSAAGAQLLFSDTLSSIWSQKEQPVHLRVPTINAGDVITFSTRATGDHGWWTVWYHDIKFKVAKVPSYPIGFSWNRQSEWIARPDYDANTSYGNPSLDSQDQPVWSYGYTSGGGLGGGDPWYTNQPTALRWDPAWFGQTGNGSWVSSDDNSPSIGPSSTYNLNTSSASRTGVIRWVAPATLPGGLRIRGSWSVQWVNNSQQYEAVIARLPQGNGDQAEVLTSRTFTIAEQQAQIPVDLIVPVVEAGDVIVVSGRPVADHPWYIYFSDNLTFTHNCPSVVFSAPTSSGVAVLEGELATLAVAGQLVPDLGAFAPSLRWHRNGVALVDGTTPEGAVISGATTNNLSIANAKPSDSGRYTLVAANSCGQTQSGEVQVGVYPRLAFEWKRSTDWTTPSNSAAGTTLGNPDDDSLGARTWHYLYCYGGRFGTPNAWYREATTPMVWDPSWYGSGGAWAVGNDVNPPIGPGGLTDNRVDSAGRIPVVHWEAPIDLPEVLRIDGEMTVSWSGGGDQASNRAPMEVVIAHLRNGVELRRLAWTRYRQNCSSWSCLPSSEVVPVHVELPGVLRGDRIVVSGRTLTAAEGYPQHGWTTLGDDLTFSYSCEPQARELGTDDYVIGDRAFFDAELRPLSAAATATWSWYRDGVPVDEQDPRVTIVRYYNYSSLELVSTSTEDVGTYTCIAENSCGREEIFTGQIRFCPSDINEDGFLDFTDFDAYVTAYEAGDGDIADFNGDGFYDFTDFDAFVGAFEAGC